MQGVRTGSGSLFLRLSFALAAVLPTMLVGCDEASTSSPPQPPPVVAPTGPFAVGTSSFQLIDRARPEPHTQAPDDHRRFMVRVFYPAAPSSGASASYFLNALEGAANAAGLGLPSNAFDGVATHGVVDAPVAAYAQRLPSVVFSPARNIPAAFYTDELEDLASRGYAVFALSHPYGAYGTGVVVFPDGAIAEPFGAVFPHETRDQALATWSADQRFALDAIAALAQPGSGHSLSGRLDLARVGVFGHSVGGAAAAQSCLEDGRFAACSNLDGSVGTAVATGPSITRPFLLMRAESTLESTLDGFFASLAGVAYQLNVRGAGHDSFSDLTSLIEHLRAHGMPVDTSGLALGTLGPVRRYQLVSQHLAAFFGQHLRGQASPLLQSNATYPEITVIRRR